MQIRVTVFRKEKLINSAEPVRPAGVVTSRLAFCFSAKPNKQKELRTGGGIDQRLKVRVD